MERPSAATALAAQREYAARKTAEQTSFTFTVGDAFVRGIRDLGYKSTGYALNELVDNAYEAGATIIQVGFAYHGKSDAKPDGIWVADDGHGMPAEMLRLSVMWGGTHRENSRVGFGRYGFGLPSASVSVGRRFTVYSKTAEDGELFAVTVDLDDMANGAYTQPDGTMVVPQPVKATLPESITAALEKTIAKSKHKTIVFIEKLDKLDYKVGSRLQAHLLETLGITFRNMLRNVRLVLNETTVDPIDPLFLMPEGRYYDLDEDRAEPLPSQTIVVKPTDDLPGGEIRLRFSTLPPTFQRKDKTSNTSAEKNMNERFKFMKSHNGFILNRAGRQVDVVVKNPFTTFMTYDRNIKIEIDFDPTLDEEFGITTSKQQVTVSDRIWEKLREGRIEKILEQMRAHVKEQRATDEVAEPKGEEKKRSSEQAVEAAQRILKRTRAVKTIEKDIKAQQNLDRKVRETAKAQNLPLPEAEVKVKQEIVERPFRIVREANPEGPFFRTEQLGEQVVVFLNTSHRFFLDVYAGPQSNQAVRDALEVLIFVLADAELNAAGEYEQFYKMERSGWSKALEVTLRELEIVRGTNATDEEHAATNPDQPLGAA